MLRMDGFDVVQAKDPADAVALWHNNDAAMYIAGGTDLLPNLKHRLASPKLLVGISGALPRGVSEVDGELVIGAATTLAALSRAGELPMLAHAAGQVAGPQLRNMGTIGGNILLDTRCLFLNQSEFWRKSLGYCLKVEGTWCHVVGGPKTCVATQSSDCVPALLVLNARIRLLGPTGTRELALTDLFRFNGMDHLTIAPGELLTHVVVPKPSASFRGSYDKLRTRGAIDFPQLGVAVGGEFSGTGEACVATDLRVVLGAINPQPRAIKGIDAFNGRPLTDGVLDELGALVQKRARPQASVHGEPSWRRAMARITTIRAFRSLRDQG